MSRDDKVICIEAVAFLLIISLCIKLLSFRWIYKLLDGYCGDFSEGRAEDVKRIKRSVARAEKIFPWRIECMAHSLAAFLMLRRRGILAAVVFGAKTVGDRELVAHAWVKTGTEGMEECGFAPLVTIGDKGNFGDRVRVEYDA